MKLLKKFVDEMNIETAIFAVDDIKYPFRLIMTDIDSENTIIVIRCNNVETAERMFNKSMLKHNEITSVLLN